MAFIHGSGQQSDYVVWCHVNGSTVEIRTTVSHRRAGAGPCGVARTKDAGSLRFGTGFLASCAAQERLSHAYRTRHHIWGKERTVVVVVSGRLLEGQVRGILQQVASAQKWLTQLADMLARGKQRRDRARIQRDLKPASQTDSKVPFRGVDRHKLLGSGRVTGKREVMPR